MSTITSKIDSKTSDKINTWLKGNYDSDTKAEIQKLLDEGKEDELIDSFYKNLEFGTGGLRGLMGVGTNKMNKYTIGMTTQGIANYLKQVYPNEKISVAIAHDSRNNSDYFAQITADVFSANDIKVYFFKALRPTPLLSFAIRELKCQSGVVITASHNPKEYNGYKAYWNDGAQMIPPHDTNSIDEVNKISSVDQVKFTAKKENIEIISDSLEQKYIDDVYALSVSKEAIKRQHDLKIVFTPIHGTGITIVPPLLEKFGFTNVTIVKEQSEPNGNFPTVVYPNPEEAEALSLALKTAKEIDADLLLGTDPDADRVGIAIKNNKNEWQLLNGNQTGSLLFFYLLNAWKENNKLDGKQFIVKTIVTSDIMNKICADYGVECYDVLTGFKFIAGIIKENEGKKQFICGGEESYGYLVGDFVRDKDAVSSVAFIAEMTAYAKDKGTSLFEWMLDMYVKYGFYKEKLISVTKKGKSGADEIKQMMVDLRNSPPKTIGGSKLVKLLDYENRVQTDILTGVKSPIDLPKSDVLQFVTEDGTKISARPSGTEPKIKFYASANLPLATKNEYESVSVKLDEKIDAAMKDLGL